MPREMFGEVSDPTIRVGTKQWYTVPLSILAHIRDHRRPDRDSAAGVGHDSDAAVGAGVCGDAAASAASAAAPPAAVRASTPQPIVTNVNPNAAPGGGARRKSNLSPRRPRRFNVGRVRVACPAGFRAGRPAAWSAAFAAPPPPPPPRRRRSASAATSRNRRSSIDVPPVYPAIAKQAKVQGMVIIEATIGRDGSREGRARAPPGAPARRGGARRRQEVEVHADDCWAACRWKCCSSSRSISR